MATPTVPTARSFTNEPSDPIPYVAFEADGGCADVLCTFCVLRRAMLVDVVLARREVVR